MVVVGSFSGHLRDGAARAAAALAAGALATSAVLVPAAPAAAATSLPALAGVSVAGQACGAEPVQVSRDREEAGWLPVGVTFGSTGATDVRIVATDAQGEPRVSQTFKAYSGEPGIGVGDLTDNAVNTLTVSAVSEDGTTGPPTECRFLLRRAPTAQLSVFPVLGGETVYVRGVRRGGIGVPGAFVVESPRSSDVVSFAYGYSADGYTEPAEWRTVPATDNAVIPFVPERTGDQVIQVAEVDDTGLTGVATIQDVRVAVEGGAKSVPPAVTVTRVKDAQPDDGSTTFRLGLTDDLVGWPSTTMGGEVALYSGATELARTTFDTRVKLLAVRDSEAGGGPREIRVEYVQFPGAPTVTSTVSTCLTDCPFTGGTVSVQPLWTSGHQSDPAYYSSYVARHEGFSPTPSSYAYRWLRDGAPIAGAIGKIYLSSPADVGHRVSVRVTAQGPGMAPRSVTSTPFTVRARDTVHVDYGLSWTGSPWQSNYCYCAASDGKSAGLAGNGRAAQALIASPTSTSYTTSAGPSDSSEMPSSFWFETEGYVAGRGWVGQKYKGSTPYVGSIGEKRRLEAFRIKPGGPHASFYDVWYRAYVPRYGWLGWARSGQNAGTTGFGYPVEDVQIRVLPKGKKPTASGTGNAPYYAKATQKTLQLSAYMRAAGWRTAVMGGSTAGLTSTSQRLNAVRVSLAKPPYSGGIQLSAKVEGDGWRPYVNTGKVVGTFDRTNRTSAYRMRLTGEMAKRYDIYYRVHVAGTGWLGWAKNGAGAGTEAYRYRNTAVQAVLVTKGEQPLMSGYGRTAYRR